MLERYIETGKRAAKRVREAQDEDHSKSLEQFESSPTLSLRKSSSFFALLNLVFGRCFEIVSAEVIAILYSCQPKLKMVTKKVYKSSCRALKYRSLTLLNLQCLRALNFHTPI